MNTQVLSRLLTRLLERVTTRLTRRYGTISLITTKTFGSLLLNSDCFLWEVFLQVKYNVILAANDRK